MKKKYYLVLLFLPLLILLFMKWEICIALLAIPIILELRSVYLSSRSSYEELRKIRDLEKLLSLLLMLTEDSGNIELALVRLEQLLDSNNSFYELIRDLKSRILQGDVPSHYLISLSNKERGFLKVTLRELATIISNSTQVLSDLRYLLNMTRRYKAVIEEYHSLLEARRIKAKLLTLINASCMAVFSITSTLLSKISNSSSSFLHALNNNTVRIVPHIFFVHRLVKTSHVMIVIGYLCLAVLAAFYMACAMRDPKPLRYIALSMTVYVLVYILLSTIFL